jgi:MarR family transcriptional regulator, organic hydroperoxide resistance regulator
MTRAKKLQQLTMATTSKRSKRQASSQPEFHKEDFPFYWVARVHALYTLEMEAALKAVDCDIPSWRVLAVLHEQGTSSISDIATHAIAKLSTITKIVYRMKADGLVTTATAAHDGRVTEVTLTEDGERALQRVRDATSGLFARSFAGLTPAKLGKLNELLKLIFGNLQA